MLQQPILTKDYQVMCRAHNKLIEKYQLPPRYFGEGNQVTLFCTDCGSKTEKYNYNGIFQGFPDLETMTITFADQRQSIYPDAPKFPSDLANIEVEHIILDNLSSGYESRGLVYIQEKKWLVAGSRMEE